MTYQALTTNFASLVNTQFGSAKDDYLKYRGRPAKFIKEIFHEVLAPDVEELLESVENNDFTVAMSGNSTGKSHVAARLALYYFLVYDDACEIYLIATSEQQLKRVLWKEVMIVVGRFPELFEHATVQTRSISCGPARTITAVVIPLTGTEAIIEGKLSGSHVSGNEGEVIQCYIIDEADSLPNAPAVWRAIEACLSGPGAKTVALFNPRHPVGTLQTIVEDGICNVVTMTEFNHPNIIHGPGADGNYPIPGAITRKVVIQRTHAWTRELTADEEPDSTCFELPEYLCGIEGVKDRSGKNFIPPFSPGWRKVECPEYDYKVLARYPGQGHRQLISMEWINIARSKYDAMIAQTGGVPVPPEYTSAICGLDIADEGEDGNALAINYGGFLMPIETWTGIDVIKTGDMAIRRTMTHSVSRFNCDGTGIGAGTAPSMIRNHNAPAVVVHFGGGATKTCELGDFANLKAELYFEVREALKNGELMLPPDQLLIQELIAYSYDIDDKGKVVVTKKKVIRDLIKRSSDRSDALALSYYNDGKFAGRDLS